MTCGESNKEEKKKRINNTAPKTKENNRQGEFTNKKREESRAIFSHSVQTKRTPCYVNFFSFPQRCLCRSGKVVKAAQECGGVGGSTEMKGAFGGAG